MQAFSDAPPALAGGSSPVRLAAALAGLVAVPIVAWSEYTLKISGTHIAAASLLSSPA